MKSKYFHIITSILILFLFAVSSFAAEEENTGSRYFDIRFSGGFGMFRYDQIVEDGGFVINGRGYDLTWYGSQLHLSGEVHYFFRPKVSLGFGGTYLYAPKPSAMDENATVSIDAKDDGKGGFGGICGSFLIRDWSRINVMLGYGGIGVKDNYGGTGPAFTAGWSYLFPSDNVIGGIGARFLLMRLSYPGDADTRGESGTYMAVMIEASFDIAPKF